MSKSKLKAVAPKEAVPTKPKILIFGKPGAGKTWTSMDFPSVYYIDSEGGANRPQYIAKLTKAGGVYFGPEQGSMDFENIIEQVQALATEEHQYKTLVIDSISKIFNLEITKEAERLAKEGKKNEFSIDKKPAVGYVKRLISWLQRIDMNVILIAHEKAEWKNGEQVGETFDCYDKLEYELDLCLNIIKAGPNHIAKVRKSRLEEFPGSTTFPWAFPEFAKRYGEEIINKNVTQLVLALPAQLHEITYLMSIVKLPDGLPEKWFSAANVASFEEMDSDKLAKIIDMVKDKYIPKITQGAA